MRQEVGNWALAPPGNPRLQVVEFDSPFAIIKNNNLCFMAKYAPESSCPPSLSNHRYEADEFSSVCLPKTDRNRSSFRRKSLSNAFGFEVAVFVLIVE